MADQEPLDRDLQVVTVETPTEVMTSGSRVVVAAQVVVVQAVDRNQMAVLACNHQLQELRLITQGVVADHQRQVLVATDHLMAVLAETAAVVKVIKRVVTRLFHQPLEPQTQAAAAVIAAQVGQVL